MLGILLIYFIGKKFFDLADDYEKSKWGFAILGIAIYYAVGFLLGVIMALFNADFIENTNDLLLGLIVAPFGILGCYLLYVFLEKKWKDEQPKTNTMIENIGKNKHIE